VQAEPSGDKVPVHRRYHLFRAGPIDSRCSSWTTILLRTRAPACWRRRRAAPGVKDFPVLSSNGCPQRAAPAFDHQGHRPFRFRFCPPPAMPSGCAGSCAGRFRPRPAHFSSHAILRFPSVKAVNIKRAVRHQGWRIQIAPALMLARVQSASMVTPLKRAQSKAHGSPSGFSARRMGLAVLHTEIGIAPPSSSRLSLLLYVNCPLPLP